MKTPEQIADEAIRQPLGRSPRQAAMYAVEADRAQRTEPNASHIPAEFSDFIESLCGTDYSLYVLDGQSADCTERHEPSNEGGDCYHDALVVMGGLGGERVVKFTMGPDGSTKMRPL